MPDFSPEIIRKAADAIEAMRLAGSVPDRMGPRQRAEAEARAALDAVAADLGQHVAAKIYEHRDNYGDRMADPARARARRRDLGIAAQVAAKAFLTGDDLKRMAATALAAGSCVACTAPEDSDEH